MEPFESLIQENEKEPGLAMEREARFIHMRLHITDICYIFAHGRTTTIYWRRFCAFDRRGL